MPLANDTITRDGLFSNSDGTFTRGTMPNSAAGFFSSDSLLEATNRGSNVFDDWFNPQDKELRQQGYQMMQDYLSPQNKMAGMRATGINPLTAAAGIAGSATSSTPPASSVNPIGDIAGAVGSFAAGGSDVAKAVETGALLGVTKKKIESETIKNLESAGLDHWQAMSIAELLPGMEANQRADFYLKLGQLDKVKQEYKNLEAEHDNIIAQYNEILARTDVYRSEKELKDAQEGLTNEQKRWQAAQNDFFIANGYAADSPLDVSLRNSIVTGKGDPSQIAQSVEDYHYRSSLGDYTADKVTAYDRAHNAAIGSYNADPYQQSYREAYDTLDKLYDYRTEAQNLLYDLNKLHDEGKVSDTEWWNKKAEIEHNIELMNDDIKSLEKVFAKMHFSSGHPSFLQSIAGSLGIQLRINNK